MNPYLPSEEDDALKRILRHHDALTSELLDHLGQFINWVHECDKLKSQFQRQDPKPLISLLGGMGIYGADYIDKVIIDNG